jgi:hypothetical protein
MATLTSVQRSIQLILKDEFSQPSTEKKFWEKTEEEKYNDKLVITREEKKQERFEYRQRCDMKRKQTVHRIKTAEKFDNQKHTTYETKLKYYYKLIRMMKQRQYFTEAKKYYNLVFDILQKNYGIDHPRTLTLLSDMNKLEELIAGQSRGKNTAKK